MKWLMHLLVIANLLTFAWFCQHQESLQVSKITPDHTVAPDSASTIWLLSELDPVMELTANTQLPQHAMSMCHTVGPFKDLVTANEALTWIKEFGGDGAVRVGKANVNIGYWVFLKSMAANEVELVIEDLKNKGIKDYHQNKRNELSLGIYNRLQDAERRQKSITAQGYTPLVEPLFRNRTRYWVDATDTDNNLVSDETWNSYLAQFPDIQRQTEECTLIKT